MSKAARRWQLDADFTGIHEPCDSWHTLGFFVDPTRMHQRPSPSDRPESHRPRHLPRGKIHPFFPGEQADQGRPCRRCRRDNIELASVCRHCGLPLDSRPFGAVSRRAIAFALVALALIGLGFLGLLVAARKSPAPAAAVAQGPSTPSNPRRVALGAGFFETGPRWTIYSSLDRLTDAPLFGAQLENRAGVRLASVLCANGRGTLSLDETTITPSEAASGNRKRVLAAIELHESSLRRRGERIELRFDDEPVESVALLPPRPAALLRRIASSRRVRTANDEFDTREIAPFIERVISACGFGDASS